MSSKSLKYKTSTIFFIAVPLILLMLFSFVFKKENTSVANNETLLNPYLKAMPIKYATMLDNTSKDKEVFRYHIIDQNFNRRIVIFIESPKQKELTSDFNIEVYPSPKAENAIKAKKVNYKLTNNGAIYQYRNNKYVVFNFELPYYDIDKLLIKQLNKSETILNPYKKIEKPVANNFLKNEKGLKSEPNIYLPLLCSSLQENNISYTPYTYKTEEKKLLVVTQNVKDYIASTQSTIVNVNKPRIFWENLTKRKDIDVNTFGIDKEAVNVLFNKYKSKEIALNQLFNLNKLAKFQTLLLLYTGECFGDLYFKYNKKDNLLEPFFNRSKCIGKASRFINKPTLKNPLYLKIYIDALIDASQKEMDKEAVFSSPLLSEEIHLINTKFPTKVFDINYIEINQKRIKKSLNQSTIIRPEFVSINKETMVLDVTNLSYYPVSVLGLNYDTKKIISPLDNQVEIESGQKKTITISLPRSFENLFVSKKNKQTGFQLSKHIYDLYITYVTTGLDEVNYATILPYKEIETIKGDVFRDKKIRNNHPNIIVNDKEKIITFSKQDIVISKPLIITEGYTFRIKQGSTIDIVEGGKIISYSPLSFMATNDSPITITSSDKKGQGIIVLSCEKESKLQHVTFNNLRNLSHGNWSVSGAVTFYESPVNLNYVTISNNKCEDALNIVRTTFIMKNSTISNTQSDAFDGDFVTGTIIDSKFINLGNDAIDVSGSDLNIINVDISYAGDKGLSAGEDSKMTVDNVSISFSEIAIAGKDLSIINAKNININNTKLGFTAFQKKPEFGPSKITVNNVKMDRVEIEHLVENTSVLMIDNKKIKTSNNVKDRMYGAEFGVSSDKTRNSQ